jgi:hypothetical protein
MRAFIMLLVLMLAALRVHADPPFPPPLPDFASLPASYAEGTLSITPSIVFLGQSLVVSGSFQPGETVTLVIASPVTTSSFNATADNAGGLRFSYQVPVSGRLGTYRVTAYPIANPQETQSGTFTVREQAASLHLLSENITQGTPFIVYGEQFFANESITLLLIGGGTTVTNTARTNADGEFSYAYLLAEAGSYTVTARSGTAVASIPVNIQEGNPSDVEPGAVIDVKDAQVPEQGSAQAVTPIEAPLETTPQVAEPVSEPVLAPVDLPPERSWRWLWVLCSFFAVVGLTIGYFIYNGAIDISDPDACKESIRALLSGGLRRSATRKVSSPDHAADRALKSFIFSERAKGFDDLTIRSALIARGWEKGAVDRIFDEIYRSS